MARRTTRFALRFAIAAIASVGRFPAVAQQAMPASDASTQPPSALVSSAINVVAKAGSSVDLNKWKGSNTMREEVDANLASIQKDLSTTLPPLLAASDAAPESAAAALPVLLNVDALYSVLLRVTVAAHTGAPRDQNSQLEQSAVTLDNARRDLGDRITALAAASEKNVSTLQATVQQQAAALQAAQMPPAPVPLPPPAAPPKKKKTTTAAKPTKPAVQ